MIRKVDGLVFGVDWFLRTFDGVIGKLDNLLKRLYRGGQFPLEICTKLEYNGDQKRVVLAPCPAAVDYLARSWKIDSAGEQGYREYVDLLAE